MDPVTATFRKILKQAQQLPPKAQRQLAETLLRPDNEDEQITLCVIAMRQFRPNTQERFQDLMDRNNNGQLSVTEYDELKILVDRYEAMVLLNTETLLRATSPELFTKSGWLKWRRLDRALRSQKHA